VNYNYQKERNIRLEVEKDVSKTKLEKKQLELVSKTNFIAQRNNYLNILKLSILKLKDKNNDPEKISFEIEKEINRIIGSEKIFENFESQFTEVYPEFFKSLVLKYGKLSQTDLRLCAYIKMNQSTNEISQITGVAIRTVETQRYRLGKKLKLSDSESINSAIITI
jgi:DNA-binding CsgD family transcriptional regulator